MKPAPHAYSPPTGMKLFYFQQRSIARDFVHQNLVGFVYESNT